MPVLGDMEWVVPGFMALRSFSTHPGHISLLPVRLYLIWFICVLAPQLPQLIIPLSDMSCFCFVSIFKVCYPGRGIVVRFGCETGGSCVAKQWEIFYNVP